MEAITKRPVVLDTPDGDVIAIRPIMNMVLAIDHRANDGAQAAGVPPLDQDLARGRRPGDACLLSAPRCGVARASGRRLMRIFVTGGAGFIGLAVVRRLVGRGDRVMAIVRDPDRATALTDLGVEIRAGDLPGRPPSSMRCAAPMPPSTSPACTASGSRPRSAPRCSTRTSARPTACSTPR